MKKSITRDIKLIIGLLILSEFVHIGAMEISAPRSTRELVGFVADVAMIIILTIALFRRHRMAFTAIIYGLLTGISLFLIHLIQYPTATNWYIILWKVGGAVILPLIFVPILRGIWNRYLSRKIMNWRFEQARQQISEKSYSFSNAAIIEKIDEKQVIVSLPIYVEEGAKLLVKKIFTSTDSDEKIFYLSNGKHLHYLVVGAIAESKLYITNLGDERTSNLRIEQEIHKYFQTEAV